MFLSSIAKGGLTSLSAAALKWQPGHTDVPRDINVKLKT